MASLDEFARQQQILASLKLTGHVSVSELATRFGVSTVTIRKDLELLERRHLLRRVRGGGVSVEAGDEGAFEMRMRYSRDSKQAIARTVAPLVHDGDVIAIDSSTSSYYLTLELLERRNLVVITNGLRHALLFMEQSTAMVLLLGGVVRRSAGSVVGPIGNVLAGRGRIAAGFFGVVGISTTHGLMDISSEEAQTKHFMADACDKVYGLFDSSKIGGFGLHSFAAPSTIAGMYTDDGAAPDVIAEWSRLGVPMVTAATEARAQVLDMTSAVSQRERKRSATTSNAAPP